MSSLNAETTSFWMSAYPRAAMISACIFVLCCRKTMFGSDVWIKFRFAWQFIFFVELRFHVQAKWYSASTRWIFILIDMNDKVQSYLHTTYYLIDSIMAASTFLLTQMPVHWCRMLIPWMFKSTNNNSFLEPESRKSITGQQWALLPSRMLSTMR